MDRRRDEDMRAAMDSLRRIVRALRLAAADAERELGITVAQLFVLQQIALADSPSINELAAATVTDPSTISGLLRRLLDAGLVTRKPSPTDARRAEVSLTRKGAALVARAPNAPQAELVTALGALPRKDLRALAKTLAQVAAGLGAVEPVFFFENERRKAGRRRA